MKAMARARIALAWFVIGFPFAALFFWAAKVAGTWYVLAALGLVVASAAFVSAFFRAWFWAVDVAFDRRRK